MKRCFVCRTKKEDMDIHMIKSHVYICRTCLSSALRNSKFFGFTIYCTYHKRKEQNARYALFVGKRFIFFTRKYRICTAGISYLLLHAKNKKSIYE